MKRDIRVLLDSRPICDLYTDIEEFYDTRKYLEIVQEKDHKTIITKINKLHLVEYAVCEER